MPALAKKGKQDVMPQRAFVILQGDDPLAFVGQSGAFVVVAYPYRKTKDMYISTKREPFIVCCNGCEGEDKTIYTPKKKPSKAGERRFTRHVLSHHRRAKTLLKWFDGLKSLDGVIKRVVNA